jgi:quercetin dioxygenase-like cupin family protein
VQVLTFDRAEHEVTGPGSIGLHATRIAQFAETARATCLTVAPGGAIGTHPAGSHQVLLIVAGSGWVAGSDGSRVAVTSGQAAYWEPGEVHTTTAGDDGLTAIALEGGPAVTVFEPEAG